MIRPPGPMRGGLGSGLVGDTIGNQKLHGGNDQAVYAYAREDLDGWETQLARTLTNGMFGENLTTTGVDVTQARIGERWRVGTDGLVLEVSRAPYPMSYLLSLPATGQLDQDIYRGGETRCLSTGYLTRHSARRGHDLHRLPPRSRRVDRPRIPRPHVRPGPAPAVVGCRCAVGGAQNLCAPTDCVEPVAPLITPPVDRVIAARCYLAWESKNCADASEASNAGQVWPPPSMRMNTTSVPAEQVDDERTD